MDQQTKPGYYAVIPAAVRYDESLRPNAKLLYAEITALASSDGYCWASNERIASWYGISPKTVGALIQQLAEKHYIRVELIRDEKQAITGRRLWVASPDGEVPPILKNEDTPILKNEETPPKNEDTPILKNEDYNNTSNIINTPHTPQRGKRAKNVNLSQPEWKPERFAKFWEYYPIHTSKQAAIRAWDRLKPGDELIADIGKALRRQMATDMWTRGVGIPYAATYLNQRRWEDEPNPVRDLTEPACGEEAPIVWL